MPDTVGGIEFALDEAITRRSTRRQHLTDPIRRNIERSAVPGIRQPLPVPAGEVRSDDVMGRELHVYLDEDPPATWTAMAIVIIVRTADEATYRTLHLRVSWKR